MKKSCLFLVLSVAVAFLLLSACASSHYKILKPPVDSNSQKFLDLIRYIITTQEERIFREMPPEDRGEFIMDFWARRDSDPSTPENEFRSVYYTRLAVADKAFRAGIPGWMTDKGRIYILLGPPTDVIRKAMGDKSAELSRSQRELSTNLLEEGTFTERPTDIWIYNQYPDYFAGPLRLTFVDYEGTGNYKLTTDVEVKPFSMMSPVQSDPDKEKYQWIGEIEGSESLPSFLPFLDYSKSLGEIQKNKEGAYSVECAFDIPYRAIRYQKNDDGWDYDLELSIEVKFVGAKSSYRENKLIRKHISSENLKINISQRYTIRESFFVPLNKGKNEIYFSVRDNISQKRLRKLDIVEIKK
jgi:GWxTD domain-containing protein